MNPLKGKDIKALKAQGLTSWAAGIRSRAWTPYSPSPVRRGPDGRTALPRHPRPAQAIVNETFGVAEEEKLAAVWEWLSGEGSGILLPGYASWNRDGLIVKSARGVARSHAGERRLRNCSRRVRYLTRMSGMGGPVVRLQRAAPGGSRHRFDARHGGRCRPWNGHPPQRRETG